MSKITLKQKGKFRLAYKINDKVYVEDFHKLEQLVEHLLKLKADYPKAEIIYGEAA